MCDDMSEVGPPPAKDEKAASKKGKFAIGKKQKEKDEEEDDYDDEY